MNIFKLKEIPEKTGCYLFKNSENEIMYIGKAKNLKKRIFSHFQETNKSKNFIPKIKEIETFITNNSKEAFLLEQNLIDKWKPRYNTLLKHNGNYPYLSITSGSLPNYKIIYKYFRNHKNLWFGPFPEGSKVKEIISLFERIFPLSKCGEKNKKKPCIYYEMGQCSGSCFKEVPSGYYDSIKKKISDFFNGKTKEVKKIIEKSIQKNNRNYFFEESKKQKKILDSIDFLTSEQNIETKNFKSRDFWGIFLKLNILSIKVFIYRYGKLSTSYEKIINLENLVQENNEVLESVITEFYKKSKPPQEIFISKLPLYKKEIEEEFKVKIFSPNSGENKKSLELANKNAENLWELNFEKSNSFLSSAKKEDLLIKIRDFLNLKKIPKRIVALDISNISFKNSVACFSFFIEGDYRNSVLYRLSVKNSDIEFMNLACEKHFLKDKKYDHQIDLFIVDGGKMQVNTVKSFFEKEGMEIEVVGLVKDYKHKTSKIINTKMQELRFPNEEIKKIMSNIQETVHNIAINFHRKVHREEALKTN